MKKAIIMMALAMGLFADQTAICEKVAIGYVKDRMNDDSSFKKVSFDLKQKDGSYFGVLTFKGTNVYGGVVENMMFFDLNVSKNKCQIIKSFSM